MEDNKQAMNHRSQVLLKAHQALPPALLESLPENLRNLNNGFTFRVLSTGDDPDDEDENSASNQRKGDGESDDDPDNGGWDDEDEESGDAVRILDAAIYTNIGQNFLGDGLTAEAFRKQLSAAGPVDQIRLRINSAGGSVFEAQAIYSLLTEHKAKKVVKIDGLAASAAGLVAMAGDKVIMRKNAMFMIHDPWSLAMGNAEDLRKEADTMDKVRESIVAVYQEKTGLSEADIKSLMTEETWLSATGAKAKGFADEVRGKRVTVQNAGKGRVIMNKVMLDLSGYRKVPTFEPVAVYHEKTANAVTQPQMSTQANPVGKEPTMNATTLREQYPALYQEVFNAGRQAGADAEFNRITLLEQFDDPSCQEIVAAAKQDRTKTASDIQKAAFDALKNKTNLDAKAGDRRADAARMGEVRGGDAPTGTEKEQEEKESVDAMAGLFASARNRRFGVVNQQNN